ncbi:MAG: hypothetical protein N3F67_06385, partial [Acidilobaceae archaeon]|nr:hypothetical protein [Acidilobaceae archaeon]
MTGKESYDKGITFEDTVELWLQAQGLKYERRKKLQTPIGLVVIDFFVEYEKGRAVGEAKNLSKPVDRDIVLKA